MKQFLIFAIFVCFTAAKEALKPIEVWQDKEVLALKECVREYKVDEKKYADGISDEAIVNYPEETSCLLACGLRRLMSKEVSVLDHKVTLYNGFIKLIEQAYQNGFQTNYPIISKEKVVQKVEECEAKAKNECYFLTCLEVYASKSALLAMMDFSILHQIENPVFADNP